LLTLLSCAWIFGQGSLVAKDQDAKKTSAGQPHFRFEAVSDKSLKLWEGEHPVLVYNHGVMTSQSAPNAKGRSSYFHPVYGLTVKFSQTISQGSREPSWPALGLAAYQDR
jgi:hypothetical protein